MTKRPLNRAFTLAEVLITLAVIGIVAALTIPVLINYAFERQAVSKAKETYSILAQAILQWQTDNGCVADSAKCAYDPWYGIGKQILPYLKTVESYNFSVSSSIPVTSAIQWLPEKTTTFSVTVDTANGVGYGMLDRTLEYNIASVALLANGSVVVISGNNPSNAFVMFDINGPKKPNRVGKDQFVASLSNNQSPTFNPYYALTFWPGVTRVNGMCNAVATTCNSDDGHSPMAYVLAHDKLPDFKALGYPTVP